MTEPRDQFDPFAEWERRLLARSEEAVRAAVAPLEAKLDAVLGRLGPEEEPRVGDAAVARALGYSVPGWRNFIRAREDRPEELPPFAVLNGYRIYRMSEVENWLRTQPKVRRRHRPGAA